MDNESRPVFTVAWSAEDGEWVATVGRHPSLSWLDDSPLSALAGLLTVMEESGA